jgi:hypothetical protein
MGPQIVMPQQIRMMTLAFFQDALIQKPSTISHGQMLIQTERLQSQIFY